MCSIVFNCLFDCLGCFQELELVSARARQREARAAEERVVEEAVARKMAAARAGAEERDTAIEAARLKKAAVEWDEKTAAAEQRVDDSYAMMMARETVRATAPVHTQGIIQGGQLELCMDGSRELHSIHDWPLHSARETAAPMGSTSGARSYLKSLPSHGPIEGSLVNADGHSAVVQLQALAGKHAAEMVALEGELASARARGAGFQIQAQQLHSSCLLMDAQLHAKAREQIAERNGSAGGAAGERVGTERAGTSRAQREEKRTFSVAAGVRPWVYNRVYNRVLADQQSAEAVVGTQRRAQHLEAQYGTGYLGEQRLWEENVRRGRQLCTEQWAARRRDDKLRAARDKLVVLEVRALAEKKRWSGWGADEPTQGSSGDSTHSLQEARQADVPAQPLQLSTSATASLAARWAVN
jgi:hypothetical protein